MPFLSLDFIQKGMNIYCYDYTGKITTIMTLLQFIRFKLKTGPKELMFEHYAWMSSQFSTFAELFDEAIRQGLPAVQTQHPGYYFQLAANHASSRQSSCKELCEVHII